MTDQHKHVGILSVAIFVPVLLTSLRAAGAQASFPIPSTSPQPSPTPLMEERLEILENQVDSLIGKVESPPKDIWDKIEAISGLISGSLIASIGLAATYVYRERQRTAEEARSKQEIATQQAMTVQTFMPQLQSGDDRAVEAALQHF